MDKNQYAGEQPMIGRQEGGITPTGYSIANEDISVTYRDSTPLTFDNFQFKSEINPLDFTKIGVKSRGLTKKPDLAKPTADNTEFLKEAYSSFCEGLSSKYLEGLKPLSSESPLNLPENLMDKNKKIDELLGKPPYFGDFFEGSTPPKGVYRGDKNSKYIFNQEPRNPSENHIGEDTSEDSLASLRLRQVMKESLRNILPKPSQESYDQIRAHLASIKASVFRQSSSMHHPMNFGLAENDSRVDTVVRSASEEMQVYGTLQTVEDSSGNLQSLAVNPIYILTEDGVTFIRPLTGYEDTTLLIQADEFCKKTIDELAVLEMHKKFIELREDPVKALEFLMDDKR